MATVGDLAQHLIQLDPQKNVARLAFYHYLKNVCSIRQDFTSQLLNQFYRRALCFQYWQTHQETLGQTVEHDLRLFYGDLGFDINIVPQAHQMQVICIRFYKDLHDLIFREVQQFTKPGERMQLIHLSDQRLMVLRLFPDQRLEVFIYSNLMLLREGQLLPLTPVTHLRYNRQMELVPELYHTIEVSQLMFGRFQVSQGRCHGLLVRGHTFQKFESIHGPLNHSQELFFSLKTIERHFVDPQSDPFYQELVGSIEKAGQLLRDGQVEAETYAEEALKRGRVALKNIFPNDKLLKLL